MNYLFKRSETMQLIYGNDGINYRVFAKSVHIPLRAENLLKSSYMHYHFVNKSQFYASITRCSFSNEFSKLEVT